MLVVLAGEVRIVLPSRDGREQVLRVMQPGDVLGEMAVLDGGPRSADAVAQTNGRLLQLERRDVIAQMHATPVLAEAILAVLSERLRTTSWLLEALLFHDAAARLAAILLALSQGQAGRRVDITQSALGERIGASRETVNRRLREWQGEGIIALEPGRITVLDPAALRRLAPPSDLAEDGIPPLW
jgi:CRP-like cAMP-binding protein